MKRFVILLIGVLSSLASTQAISMSESDKTIQAPSQTVFDLGENVFSGAIN